MQKVKMDSAIKTFTFIVKEKPFSAGIDPYLKLIDRKPDNNTCNFGQKPVIPELISDKKKTIEKKKEKK
jgi:hypothetical protein